MKSDTSIPKRRTVCSYEERARLGKIITTDYSALLWNNTISNKEIVRMRGLCCVLVDSRIFGHNIVGIQRMKQNYDETTIADNVSNSDFFPRCAVGHFSFMPKILSLWIYACTAVQLANWLGRGCLFLLSVCTTALFHYCCLGCWCCCLRSTPAAFKSEILDNRYLLAATTLL